MWVGGLVRLEGERRGVDGPGKFVVAATNIPPDTLLLFELPAVFGPKQSGELLVCVQCCSALKESSGCCPACGLPLCPALACQQSHAPECALLAGAGLAWRAERGEEAVRAYSVVTVLRLLLRGGTDQWESHASARHSSPVWLWAEHCLVPPLTKLGYTAVQVHQAAGVLDTNTFEVREEAAGEVARLGRALYTQAALLNNSCVPNCRRRFRGTEIMIETTRAVEAGEELNICYTGLLQPTRTRQTIFLQTKHFLCGCRRCGDPTELGSHLASLACGQCGTAVPAGAECCGTLLPTERAEQVEELCSGLVRRLGPQQDCQVWPACLAKLRRLLGPHHHTLVQLMQRFLHHAAACRDCGVTGEAGRCRIELDWVYEALGAGPAPAPPTKPLTGGKISNLCIDPLYTTLFFCRRHRKTNDQV